MGANDKSLLNPTMTRGEVGRKGGKLAQAMRTPEERSRIAAIATAARLAGYGDRALCLCKHPRCLVPTEQMRALSEILAASTDPRAGVLLDLLNEPPPAKFNMKHLLKLRGKL